MDDLPRVTLHRFYRGASTAGLWNLIVHDSPARIFRLFSHGSHWRGFEIDPQDDRFRGRDLSAPTRREVIENIRVALWAEG